MPPCGLSWASALRSLFSVWSSLSMRSDVTRANWRKVILIPKNSKLSTSTTTTATQQQQPEHKKLSINNKQSTTTTTNNTKNVTKQNTKKNKTQQKIYNLVNKLQIKDVWSCIRNAQQTNTHTLTYTTLIHTHTDICDVLTLTHTHKYSSNNKFSGSSRSNNKFSKIFLVNN